MTAIPFYLPESGQQPTFDVVTDLFDYKLTFNCPFCGTDWQTSWHSSVLEDERLSSTYVHCTTVRGCGERFIIKFIWE